MKSKIAFLGIGAMGLRIVKNLITEGHDITVYNRNPQKCEELVQLGAKLALTPYDASLGNEFVISMVTNDEASEDIWFNNQYGAIKGLSRDAIALELSTLSLDWTRTLHQRMLEQEKNFIEAPVIGSLPQVENRQIAFLLGGDSQHFAKVSQILKPISNKVLELGPAGNGAKWKLIVNTLFSIQVCAFSEMATALEKSGVEKELILNLLPELPITSPVMKVMISLMLNENYSPLFPIDLVEKDLGYSMELLKEFEVEPTMLAASRFVFKKAQSKGYGENNISGIYKVYQNYEKGENDE